MAVREKKSQVNQKSPSAVLPWGYSSPINVLFAKITDNCTIKSGRWREGIKERSSNTRGKNEREKQEEEKKWERKEHGLLRKNDKWTS